ncbi:hypothetical protein B0H16DRAFT_1778683 [Mycena metata]|uniref:Nephrocystin 3-like N-terminal domain-containing protein n=1 Tax=Mycena metata TaxID=1033252 RepID=A0AAD7MQH9_9AGAR|nr:hypothetical protein B0H16DRAFT_1778683 [Mycena metata]
MAQSYSLLVVPLEIKADGKVSGRLSVLLEKSEVAAGRATSRMESTLVTLTTAGPSLNRINAAVEAEGSQNDLASALGACLDHIDVVVHPYVSAAWSILSSVYQAVKQQHEMDNKVVKLVKDIVELYSFKDDIHFVVAKIQILEDTLIKIAKHTLVCANFLAEYSQPKFSERAIQTAFVNDNQRRIDDLLDELVKLKESFTHALRIQILLLTTEVHGTVAKLDESEELKKLSHISYDASLRTGCLPGTREDILADISNWLTTPSSGSNILWLSGVAGSGKSSIATTLSQRLREADHLGAFLFFTRNNLANSNPTAVLHTIAYRLAQSNAHIRVALCTVIAQPRFSERAIRTAFVNDNERRIDDLLDELVKLKESFTHALRIQSLLLTTEVHGTVAKLDKSEELKKLRHLSYDASLRTGCLPGTREDILADISNWLTTPLSNGNILWLSGVAGSGKSSVATTLSQHLREADRLGAFLFFTRNNLANSNPTAVLHTITYRLAQFNAHIRDALCTVIAQKREILEAPIHHQFEALLRGPLRSAEPTIERPVIIILDALDECSNNDWRKSLISLIVDDL